MIINRQVFLKFLKSIALQNNSSEANDMIFNFSTDKIETTFTVKGNIYAIFGTLNGKFNNVGEFGVFDLNKLISIISTTPAEEIEFIIENNKFVLKCPNFAFRTTFKAVKYVSNTITREKQEKLKGSTSQAKFSLSKKDMLSLISIVNAFKSKELILKGHKREIELSLEDIEEIKEDSLIAKFEADNEIPDFSVKLNKVFIDLLKLVDIEGVTSFHIKNDAPIMITNSNNDWNISYLLAPIKVGK